MKIKKILNDYGICLDLLKDQFFLEDEDIIKKIVRFANLNKEDVVLEVGAGIGNLTNEIAKKAGKVIAFELDPRFKSFLSKSPQNVEVRYEDAWDFIQLHGKFRKKKIYNKIISNLPYSFCEPFLHNLTFLDYDKVILLVPQSFANKIAINPVFSSFFNTEEKLIVEKHKFYPVPRTNSVIIDLHKLPDPLKQKTLSLFLRQFIYQHEEQKTKNSLREGIIKFAWLAYQKIITKKEAKKLLDKSDIENGLLESQAHNSRIYQQITDKLSKINI